MKPVHAIPRDGAPAIERALLYIAPTEILILGNALVWVVWTWWPGLDVFSASRSFGWMAGMADQRTWGALFALGLTVHVLALARHWWRIRRTLIFGWALLYGLLGWAFCTSNLGAPGGGTYIVMGATCGLLYLRLGADARAASHGDA